MSVHRKCGADITWPNRDGWRGPLDYLGQTITMREGAAVWVPSYRPHECDPEQAEKWQAEQKRLAREHRTNWESRQAERERAAALREVRERERAQVWTIALKRDCPKCGVQPGEECLNLNAAAKGQTKRTSWPHQDRLDSAPDPVPFDDEESPSTGGR